MRRDTVRSHPGGGALREGGHHRRHRLGPEEESLPSRNRTLLRQGTGDDALHTPCRSRQVRLWAVCGGVVGGHVVGAMIEL